MNDADYSNLRSVVESCIARGGQFTLSVVDMLWDEENPKRPLRFQQGKMMRADLDHCENAERMFMYKEGFEGKKKRTVIILE